MDGRYRDRQLKGDARRFRELHIQGDWLLAYRVEGEQVILARTGTHGWPLVRMGWSRLSCLCDARFFPPCDMSV
ncbi:type II toxin-antitoxin system mRNA interferase toxin, RelE/StbE family [Bifidobacterium sp.]|uniref:type II toxin-antitoxin system mRNA interferase toxin, RelE/StbE family n=1 Tax=Bifidobacterium sp. TaxID=41200 RepID=UPI0039EBF8E2